MPAGPPPEPEDLTAFKRHARALTRSKAWDDSLAAWQRVWTIASEDPECLFELGSAHQRRGDLQAAIGFYRQALDVKPDFYEARGMLLLAMLYGAEPDAEILWQEQKRWAAQRPPPAGQVRRSHDNDPDPRRPLRIGYLSSDYRGHPVGFFMLPVHHYYDRSAFQVFSYVEVERPDATTARLRELSDAWRNIVGKSDAEVAQMVADDRIDILVILAGHLDRNRPMICRYRPAPIQVSHGDVCTSAMPEIDYLIADPFIVPRSATERFSERILRLPWFAVHPIPAEAPEPKSLPARRSGRITFGSFNRPTKITPAVADVWSAVLHAVPDSRLLLKHLDSYSEAATRDRITAIFRQRGISGERIDMIGTLHSRAEHFRFYHRVDIALDPFPFNGVTTTFEALLMGVPVINLIGDRMVARFGASLLKSVGLDPCIAGDPQDYIRRAVEMAGDLERLAVIRRMLRPMLKTSRLCNARRYTRNLERLYRAMWRRWCAVGAVPKSPDIPSQAR